MSHQTSTAKFFDTIAGRYDREYALAPLVSRVRMSRIVRELPRRASVLDLGVGTGRELSALQDAEHSPTGLDISREMLAICARRARPIPTVEADLWLRLPFHDGSFDAVIALHGTLAHPPNQPALDSLSFEVERVLRPDGVFMAEVPTSAWLTTLGRTDDQSDTRARRTGPNECLCEDLASHASITATFYPAEAWRDLFAKRFDTKIEPLGDFEVLIIAKKRRPTTGR